MMKPRAIALVGLLVLGTTSARAADLQPSLNGLGFLVGHWSTPTRGHVADTGGTSSGEINFKPEVGGAVLLRKDHVSLFDKSGKATGGFDILMMIYAENGTVRADYADGQHVIHYTSAAVEPGRSVVFTSASRQDAPTFMLSYTSSGPKALDINFSMAPPGSSDFHPIATGSAVKR